MKELFQVVTLEEARRLMAGHFFPSQKTEQVRILNSLNRCLAQDAKSDRPVPGFDRSTVDGYAVRAADTFGASESLPALFNLVGKVRMGSAAKMSLGANQAVAIATGGMLPPGADAVVMVEYTEKLDDLTIEVAKTVAPGDNVLRAGEDVADGAVILPSGTKMGPFEMGLAAAAGCAFLEVTVPYRVGIISTGEELVAPETVPGPGQVRDINSYCLAGLIEKSGGEPVLYEIVRDNRELLTDTLYQAVRENDLVVISGGSSVGTQDFTLDVLEEGLLFHGLAIRPGKPTLAAVIEKKMVVGLPGHPASAAIIFYLLVRPLLQAGNYDFTEKTVWATISRSLASGPGREDYFRVKLIGQGQDTVAHPVLGKSGLIHTLAEADGLVRVPLHKEGISAGERVEVILF